MQSLQYLNNKGVAHLDLSPQNILVIYDFDKYNSEQSIGASPPRFLQITNFSMSAGFYKKKFSTNKISSFYFMAPERILGELEKGTDQAMTSCDIWSVGVILFMLMFGRCPFQGETNSMLVKSIKKAELGFKQDQTDNPLINLIQRMLQADPRARIDVAQALSCEFLTQDFEKDAQKLKKSNLARLKEFWCTA